MKKLAYQAGIRRVVFETPYETSKRNPGEVIEFWREHFMKKMEVKRLELLSELREFVASVIKTERFSKKE